MSRRPFFAALLIRFGRHRGRRDEVEADLEDLFEQRAASHGLRYARRRYWRDVLSLCVPRSEERLLPLHPGRGRFTAGSHLESASTMSAFLFELRHVVRSIRRQPAFFAVASLTLAIGVAAHLCAFSLVDRMLLAPPARVQDASRVFRLHIERADREGGRFLWFQTPYRSYEDLRRSGGPFAAMAAYRTSTPSVGSGLDARQISIVYADEHYFALLGAAAQFGRVFGAEDNIPPSGNPVVVLSDAYWRAGFAADPAVVGRTLRIGAVTHTVVGVMPSGFNGDNPEPVDAWAPLHSGAHELPAGWTTSLLFRSVSVLTRLPDGLSHAAAADAAGAAYRRLTDGTAAADATARAVLAPLTPGQTQQGDLNQAGRIAVWIEGVSLLVLLVALANVVNFQISRAVQQRRELAVRVALGAGRMRLLTKVALEMLFIVCAATLAGVVLTYWSATTLQQLLVPGVQGTLGGARFGWVLAATIVVCTVLGIGLSALHIRMKDVSDRLKTGRGGDGFGRERVRQTLLIAQVVVSTLLLVGAGLFLRSIDRLGRLQFGHDQDRVLVVTLPLRGAGYAPAAIETFYERSLTELNSLPGIEGVAAAQSTPFAPSQSADLRVPGLERLPFDGRGYPTFYTVTPGFFQTMGVKILRGRGFTDADRAGAPAVIVLEDSLAKKLWPDQDAIGKCMVVGVATGPCREVVGVSTNTRRFVSTGDGALRYYVPMAQRVNPATPQALFVRTSGAPAAAMPAVRSALLAIDGNLPFARMRVLADMAEPEKRPWRLGSTLFVLFGAAALIVAMLGVYALLSFIVTQRSREIGVRLALGASPGRTLRLVVQQSLGWASIGLFAGLAAAAAAGKFIRPVLFETSPYDPAVFGGAAGLLIVVTVAASLVPAFRASRLDPNVTLRAE